MFNTAGYLDLIAALFRRAIRDVRSRDAILAAEAEFFLRCPEVKRWLANVGIRPDYFYRLLEQES
ncbi:MAG: hypothetical protein PVF45_15145 [Anaerolineae bacterium]|jgi:hypothetical protein